MKIFERYKDVFLYGISLAILLLMLRWIELRFLIFSHSYEIYIGFIALGFTALGIWLAQKLSKPKTETIFIEKEAKVSSFIFNHAEAQRLNLSKRELEVLQLMAEGLSNQEIANKLFISLNTVKTHSSNLFEKLAVIRRTQAVEKAKNLSLIA